jgi:hypothetical protein
VEAKPGEVPAFEHQVKVVEILASRRVRLDRLDHRPIRIIDQYEDMRQLERSSFADCHARGKPIDNRALRGADQAG